MLEEPKLCSAKFYMKASPDKNSETMARGKRQHKIVRKYLELPSHVQNVLGFEETRSLDSRYQNDYGKSIVVDYSKLSNREKLIEKTLFECNVVLPLLI